MHYKNIGSFELIEFRKCEPNPGNSTIDVLGHLLFNATFVGAKSADEEIEGYTKIEGGWRQILLKRRVSTYRGAAGCAREYPIMQGGIRVGTAEYHTDGFEGSFTFHLNDMTRSDSSDVSGAFGSHVVGVV